jgi:hypothetical protein
MTFSRLLFGFVPYYRAKKSISIFFFIPTKIPKHQKKKLKKK